MEQNHSEEIDKLPETKEKSVRWSVCFRITGIVIVALVLAYVVYLWLCTIVPGVMMRRESMQELSPLIKEAKSLGLTYESVLKYPDKALGKPAIWCIQNRGPEQVLYEGKQDKRIFVSNEGSMPLYIGDKHSICADMLVVIGSVKESEIIDFKKKQFGQTSAIDGAKTWRMNAVSVEFVHDFVREP